MYIGLFIKNYASGKQFSKDGVPIKSGAEFHAENHAKLFIKNGDNVTVFTKKIFAFTKIREVIDGIEVCRLHGGVRWLEIVARLLTTHKSIDAFYILGTPKFAVWGIIIARILNKPVTLALTSTSEIFEKKDTWRNKIFSKCDNYIGISNKIAEGLIKGLCISKNKVHLLPQGVDTRNRFVPVNSIDKNIIRDKYGFDKDKKILLFCARVVENKGIDTLIRSWRIVHEKNKNIILLVVGGGVTELINKLKKISLELDNSIIITGEVDDTKEYYQLSDMYILPSWFEGLSTSTMEAMSCGLPCIGSDVPGINDLIKPANAGYLINKDDYVNFAECVLTLFERAALLHEFSYNARIYASNYLDSEILFENLRLVISNKV